MKAARATWDAVRAIGLGLPGVDAGTSYGTPALKVRGKLFARLKEDGETLVLRTDPIEREILIRAEPEVFFVTDHYRDYPWVLVRLAETTREEMIDLLTDAWRRVAPKRLIAEHDGTN